MADCSITPASFCGDRFNEASPVQRCIAKSAATIVVTGAMLLVVTALMTGPIYAVEKPAVVSASDVVETDPGGQTPPVLQRSFSDSARTRLSFVKSMSKSRPTESLRQRLVKLAAEDPSAAVREAAELQLVEWRFRRDAPGAESTHPLNELFGIGESPATHTRRDQFVSPLPYRDTDVSFPLTLLGSETELDHDDADFPAIRPDSRLPGLELDDLEENPDVLRSPFPPVQEDDEFTTAPFTQPLDVETILNAPLGFTGHSSVTPTELQQGPHFVPIEDRWRTGFPDWDRYGAGNPPVDDQPYEVGHWWDPYNQNVLKGDYPIIGQHTFLNITATSQMLHEYREVPTPTTPFESTVNPFQEEFFGDSEQYFYSHYFKLQLNLFHGSTAFKPLDWQLRMTPVFNLNYLDVEELGVVSPNVLHGTTRDRNDFALQEWFAEFKLADISPDYDFVSVRAGSQPFVSDFRGFIFADVNRGVRLFGTRLSNRDQFNLIWFDQTEKETNSELNTFHDRNQNTLIANYFRQDFVVPGYTLQCSFHYNNDQPGVEFDRNNFLVRPDPAGVFRPHRVEAFYWGIAGDGHIDRINISHAFYHVHGTDSLSPIQGQKSDIKASMAAVELSLDRDWVRFRTSYFWASGDDNPTDTDAEGFDAIFDNPNFAGGEFSYWQRQAVRLFGVNLVQRQSLVPNLRSSKLQGQSNFVNPGLHLINAGMDVEVTPKLKAVSNLNFLWFDETQVLEKFVFQDGIDRSIGTDASVGLEYRPFLNDNVMLIAGVSTLFPGRGFKDLFGVTSPFTIGNVGGGESNGLYAAFMDVILTY